MVQLGPAASQQSKRRKTRKKGNYHHGNLRRALLDAALMMVEREGAKGVSLRAVARLAGVSPAAPYRHFAGKDSLLAAVAEEGFRALSELLEEASKANPAVPLAELRAIGLAYVKFAAAHPSHFRVMFGPEIADKNEHPALLDAAESAFAIVVRAIAALQRPDLEAGMAEPRRLAVAAWATFHGLATLTINGHLDEPMDTEQALRDVANRVTDVLYRGLSYSGL
jgi:AcrR family transcriptional regulator